MMNTGITDLLEVLETFIPTCIPNDMFYAGITDLLELFIPSCIHDDMLNAGVVITDLLVAPMTVVAVLVFVTVVLFLLLPWRGLFSRRVKVYHERASRTQRYVKIFQEIMR